jgi:hypothetical protein
LGQKGKASELKSLWSWLVIRNEAIFTDTKCQSKLHVVAPVRSEGLPQKAMVVGYFAETKGLVGCHYEHRLAFKMRDFISGAN